MDTRLVILIAASALLVVSIVYFIGSLVAASRARRAADSGPETVPVPTSGADKAREAMLTPVDVHGWEPRPAETTPVVLEPLARDEPAVQAGAAGLLVEVPAQDAVDESLTIADELDARLAELAATAAVPAVAPPAVSPPTPAAFDDVASVEPMLAPVEVEHAYVAVSEPLLPAPAEALPDDAPVAPMPEPAIERSAPVAPAVEDMLVAPMPEPTIEPPAPVVEDAPPAADLLAELRASLADAPRPEPITWSHEAAQPEPSILLPASAAALELEPPEPAAPAWSEPAAPAWSESAAATATPAWPEPATPAWPAPAGVTFVPSPTPAAPPEYAMVAPVELLFTDGPKRIGIRPGTATFLKYQRLAAVLLGDLKKAKAGGS